MNKNNNKKINGWLCIDKEYGMNSTKVVSSIRKIFGIKKVGHAGTLDPLASGILPVAVGEATKTIPYIQNDIKEYEFTITWGQARDTDDLEGNIIKTSSVIPSKEQILSILPEFTGEIEQIPPQFSAIKIQGKRAYDIARAGGNPRLNPRKIFIENINLQQVGEDFARFNVTCGKGTYIRSIARDMASSLGTCGYVSYLRRLSVGIFNQNNAISLDNLEKKCISHGSEACLMSISEVLDDIPAYDVDEKQASFIKAGRAICVSEEQAEPINEGEIGIAVFDDQAIAMIKKEGDFLKPFKVFNI